MWVSSGASKNKSFSLSNEIKTNTFDLGRKVGTP
jgi:hypothetical protein